MDFENGRLNPAVIEAHFDVASHALQCGLSHTAHLSVLGKEAPHDPYRWLGNGGGHHNAHHNGKLDELMAIDTYTMGLLARLADSLSETPEGNGTMLDNSAIVYINTCGGRHHSGQDWQFAFVIGDAGGYLKTGQFISAGDSRRFLGEK